MRVRELKSRIEAFLEKMQKYRGFLEDSIESKIRLSDIDECRGSLSRDFGALRPYIERLAGLPYLNLRAHGSMTTFAGFQEAFCSDIPFIRNESLKRCIDSVNEALGALDRYDPEDDVPEDKNKPIHLGIDLEKLIVAYFSRLHPFILISCEKLYQDGHFSQAVENAIKGVLEYIRQRTSLNLDGENLINRAFGLQNGALRFSDLSDESKKNEQIGFMEMLKGFYKGVRHVIAHTHGRKENPQKAFEYIVAASLLCRRIDDAVAYTQSLQEDLQRSEVLRKEGDDGREEKENP